MKLYAIQTAGHDITVEHEPLFDYIDDRGAFYDMAISSGLTGYGPLKT